MLAFRSTVLLMCMWTSKTMRNPMFLEEGAKVAVFTAPIRLDINNFCFEKALNMCLKLEKDIKHIRFTFKQIKPCETTIGINKTDIVIVTTDRSLGMAPYIGINKFKRPLTT